MCFDVELRVPKFQSRNVSVILTRFDFRNVDDNVFNFGVYEIEDECDFTLMWNNSHFSILNIWLDCGFETGYIRNRSKNILK